MCFRKCRQLCMSGLWNPELFRVYRFKPCLFLRLITLREKNVNIFLEFHVIYNLILIQSMQ